MNIIAGDLFTHLSICAENPEISERKRTLYRQALLELQAAVEFFSIPGLYMPFHESEKLTGNIRSRIGDLFYDIFLLESQPDDEEVSFTDD